MLYRCNICKKEIFGRRGIRKHIKEEHKSVFRNLSDKKQATRKAGQPFRKSAPLAEKYEPIGIEHNE